MGQVTTSIDIVRARRLALARSGLLRPAWTGLPGRSPPRGAAAARKCLAVIGRFGYLQLDTVAVTGARTQGLVLASRLEGLDASFPEEMLSPGAPLFEYWGHEACWMPLALYPCFAFRRREYRVHPWWGDVLSQHRSLADELLARIRAEGPLRSLDMDGERRGERASGWWNLKLTKRVAEALWSCGELVIGARVNFQRIYDLPERVIPTHLADVVMTDEDAYAKLILLGLEAHGWATTSTLIATWRLTKRRPAIDAVLGRLRDEGAIVPCQLTDAPRPTTGWIRPIDLELAERLAGARMRRDQAVLLSPFDPVLWDRARAALLYGFEHVLEIYKPPAQREYGYYVLPTLAGDRFIGRVDLKAHRAEGRVEIRSEHLEPFAGGRERKALQHAYRRHANAVGLPDIR